MKAWIKLTIGLIVTILLLLHPTTRQVIIWILPLGVGISDLIAGILLLVVLLIIAIKTEFFMKLFKKWFK